MMSFNQQSNFFIFGQSRSGSNLLRSLINSHPGIFCERELLNKNYLIANYAVFKHLIIRLPYLHILIQQKKYKDKIFGFKFFLYQLENSDAFVKKLQKNNWKIIHIQRKNLLKQVFSDLIGLQTKAYYRTNEADIPTDTYNINCEQVLRSINKRIEYFKRELILLKDYEHIKVVYEDNLKSNTFWNETAKKVFEYLGVEPVEVRSDVLITDIRTDEERIENFNEIIEFLNKNDYSKFVEEYYKYL